MKEELTMVMVKCPKCHGTGLVHWDKDDGKCYCCNGTGEITASKQTYYDRKNKELETQRMAIREATKVKVEQDKQAREAQKIEDKKNGLTVYVETEYGNKAMRVTQQEYQNILRDIKNHCIFKSVQIMEVAP